MGLEFLAECPKGAAAAWRAFLAAEAQGQSDVPGLSAVEAEKLRTVLRHLQGKTADERVAVLEAVGCPEAGAVAAETEGWGRSGGVGSLVDFDWSASVVLGDSRASNVKEAVASFSFGVRGPGGAEERVVELRGEDCRVLAGRLEALRGVERGLVN